MAQKNKGPGIQSAAGLIRYFDAEEDTAFKVRPSIVLIVAGVAGVCVLLLHHYWRLTTA
ncbi:MAG: Sec61beta family [Thermoplasmata archaeon]|jgi:preprotein translocase subunit Sec61beta|nr:Sec61beta family [Thermoplasmata archaeon]